MNLSDAMSHPKKPAMVLFRVLIALTTAICIAPAFAVTPDEARHLLHRTGFGVSDAQWQSIIDLDYDAAVNKLVDDAARGGAIKPPDWVDDKPMWTIKQRGWTEDQRRELRIKKRVKIEDLRNSWIVQMLATPTPLQDRMTLFWSNHFTTQYSKSFAPMLMHQQNELLRGHSLGRFDHMLLDVLRDPLMLLYLDNVKNRANSVNENLARELMELFTMGEGHYSERDVKEAARCLTGWGVDRDTGAFRIFRKNHDSSRKTVLGKSGKFDGDDLARLLLKQAATSERVVRKLWLEFVSMEPDAAIVQKWAVEFRENDYEIASLLKTIFKSPQFRAKEHRGVLIKSPVELFVGLMRPALDGLNENQVRARLEAVPAGKRLSQLLKNAGQQLFEPPSVEGWPGGLEWIDSRTLLSREHTARNLVMGLSPKDMANNPYVFPEGDSKWNRRRVAHLNALDPVTDMPAAHKRQRLLLELILDPVVHVK
ncbi:MAG: DUF1800 family protein [Gammaproteobacteria bacterium]